MSVETEFRALVRNEVEAQLKPLQKTIAQLEESLAMSRQLESSLAPVVRGLSQVLQGGEPVKRGPGRPRRNAVVASATTTTSSRVGRKPGRRKSTEAVRACGIKGCVRPARAKGYCAAHYQKLRMLTTRGDRPSAWVDFPAPQSVEDIKLPRGRAAAKALSKR